MAKPRVDPRVVLAIASLGSAVAFIDATIVNIAFPDIARSFPGTSISSLSWVLNAYNIVFAAFLVAAGRLADVLGRRRVFRLGLVVFTVASLLCAIAPSPGALIVFRVVQALGAAGLVPAALALVLAAFPPERRSHGTALLSAVAAAAAGLGPSLGGLLVSIADWRLVFLVNLPIGAAAFVLGGRHLVESRTPGRRRLPDLPGAALFALAIAALVLGVVEGGPWGWSSWRIVAAFAAAALLGAVVAWRATWHPVPIVDLRLLRIRTFAATNAMTVLAAAGFYGYTLCNVLFLTGVWRYSVLDAGLSLTPGPFIAAAVAGPSSRLVERLGHRPVLVAGGVIWGGAVMWFVARVGVRPDFLGEWLPGMALLGIGAGTLFPNLSGAAVSSAPGEAFGAATGINSVARQVGAALGVAIVVAIIGAPSAAAAHTTFDHAWTFGAACLFAAGAGCLLVGRTDVARAPSLTTAAREVLRVGPASAAADAPRARRAIELDAPAPAARRRQSAADFLGGLPIFAGLDPNALGALAEQTRPVRLAAGQWLFHAGEPGDALYVVRTGRVEIVDESSGAVLRELGRGDALGELALLTGTPRSASARAARTSELLALHAGDFGRLLDAEPPIARGLARRLAEQLRDTRAPADGTRPRPTTVAVVGLGAGAPVATIASGLARALGARLDAACLDRTIVPGPPVLAGDAAGVYGPALDRAEAAHAIVVLDAGSLSAPDAWSEFCLQQSDRILAVASPSTPGPDAGAGVAARVELRGCDLVGYDVSIGSGALAGWAERLHPLASHIVRPAQADADLDRMARRLSGRAVGVVLSGGGARAFSHIGVLEELVAAGLVIDRVAGVSMGAFIGALFAMGLDADEIDARCFESWVRSRPLSDFTVPRHALIRGARAEAMLARTFGEARLEELPRGFFCGCADLRSGELVLSRTGRLAERVGWSIALPIIAPPQIHERRLLIDGSLVDNLPVEAMARLGEGPVIAVDVKATHGGDAARAAAAAGNGAGPARPPRPLRTPSLGETITRVLLIGATNTTEQARRHADVLVTPRADGIGLLEFHQIDAAREAGRAAARELLASPEAMSKLSGVAHAAPG